MKKFRMFMIMLVVLAFFSVTVWAGFCPNCGKKTGDADKFCAGCGKKLSPAKVDKPKPDKPKPDKPKPDKPEPAKVEPEKDIIAVDSNIDADNQYEVAKNTIWGPKFVSKKRRKRAEKLFLNLLERFPTSDKADDSCYWLGRISQKKGDDKKAIEYYLKCFELNYKNGYDYLQRVAQIYERHLKDFKNAKKYYEMVLKYDKDTIRRKQSQLRINALKKKGY